MRIIVDKKSLEQRLSRARKGDLIELRIVPPEDDCGNASPAFLHIAAIHNKNDYEDLESIDEYLSNLHVIQMA